MPWKTRKAVAFLLMLFIALVLCYMVWKKRTYTNIQNMLYVRSMQLEKSTYPNYFRYENKGNPYHDRISSVNRTTPQRVTKGKHSGYMSDGVVVENDLLGRATQMVTTAKGIQLNKIKKLTTVQRTNLTTRNTSIKKNLFLFKGSLSLEDQAATKKLLAKFLKVTTSAGVEYMMYGGTLLGSLRHHGMIPWDDDVDLWVDYADREKLQKALGASYPTYQYTEYSRRLKFYAKGGTKINGYLWTFPFIDVSFYHKNIHFIADSDPGFANEFRYPTSWIFPLVKRPFWDFFMLAPKDSVSVIEKNYKMHICQTNSYNHKLETNIFDVASVNCDLLRKLIPFVYKKHQLNGDIIEELKLGENILNSFLVTNTR